MATDPVSAFLQGFAVVDRLETNRERRDYFRERRGFEKEQQSQLRKVWKRDDDKFALEEKKRLQGEFRALFSGFNRQVMMDPAHDDTFLGDPVKVQNEILKRMIEARPDFGEAFALSTGLDPGAGTLIRNKTQPVTGAGIDPGGRGVAFTLDSINGRDVPATVNRTDAGNDPVFFGQPTSATMVDLMGPEFLTSEAQEFQMMRRFIDSQGGAGDPFRGVRGGNTPTPQTDEQIAFDAESAAIASANATRQPRTAATQSEVSGGEDEIAPAVTELPVPGEELAKPRGPVDRSTRNREGRGLTGISEDDKIELRQKMFDSDAPISTRIASTARLLAADIATMAFGGEDIDPGIVRTANAAGDSAQVLLGGPALTRDTVNAVGGVVVDTVAELLTGKAPETQGMTFDDKLRVLTGGEARENNSFVALFDSEKDAIAKDDYSGKQIADGPATSLNDIKRYGANPGDYSPLKAHQDKRDDAARALLRAPTPSSPDVARNMARGLSGGTGKPSIPNLFTAFMLTKAQYITPEQLFNYGRTSQLNAPDKPKWQLFDRGSEGGIIAVDQNDPRNVGQVVAGTGPKADPAKRLALSEAIARSVARQAEPEFAYGINGEETNERALAQFTNAYEDIASMYGIAQDDIRLTDNSTINNLAKGSRFVQRFDEDDIQFFDFKFGDFSVPYTAGNVALGAVIAEAGAVTQEDAAYALRTYIKDARPASSLKDAAFIENVRTNEAAIREQHRRAQRTGEYELPFGVIKKGRPSLEDLRQDVIDRLIELDNT